jgi:hypothetical protein
MATPTKSVGFEIVCLLEGQFELPLDSTVDPKELLKKFAPEAGDIGLTDGWSGKLEIDGKTVGEVLWGELTPIEQPEFTSDNGDDNGGGGGEPVQEAA